MRNLETGAAAVAGVSASVAEAKPSGISLFPPVLWKPERGAFFVKGFTAKASGKAPIRSLPEIVGFDTRQYVPYTEKTLSSLSEIWASFRCAVGKIAAPKIKISAFLENLEFGNVVAIPLTLLSKKDEPSGKAYLARLEIPEVEPGPYRLYLKAEEETSGESSIIANDFKVERKGSNLPTLPDLNSAKSTALSYGVIDRGIGAAKPPLRPPKRRGAPPRATYSRDAGDRSNE